MSLHSISLSFSTQGQSINDVIRWLGAVPNFYANQNYFALAIVIQKEIEPLIRRSVPEITMAGNILSPEITQCRGFNNIFECLLQSKELLDPALLHPSTEITQVARTEEKVTKSISDILFILRSKNYRSGVNSVCRWAAGRLEELQATQERLSPLFAWAIFSVNIPSFPAEIGITRTEEYMRRFRLEPICQGLLIERDRDRGEGTKRRMQLTLKLEDGDIVANQHEERERYSFTDLRAQGISWIYSN